MVCNKINGLLLAQYILKYSSKRLSNLELQKYLYLINYKLNIITEDFKEKTKLGPILSDVYIEYRNYGANSIEIPINAVNPYEYLDKDVVILVDEIINECDKQNYYSLVEKVFKLCGKIDN